MQWLAAICVKRPVFATVLVLVLTVVGVFAYGQLGVDRFPKVDFPVVTVTTSLPGASPEEIETEITDKIEAAVNTISGIDELRSTSVEGVSQVFVTFVLEKDIDVAAQEVRDKVSSRPARPAAGASTRPSIEQARPRRRADHDARALVDGQRARHDRARRQGAAPRARVDRRRRPGDWSSAAGPGRSTCGSTPTRSRSTS